MLRKSVLGVKLVVCLDLLSLQPFILVVQNITHCRPLDLRDSVCNRELILGCCYSLGYKLAHDKRKSIPLHVYVLVPRSVP